MIRRRTRAGTPLSSDTVSECEIDRMRLASTLAEVRRQHALEVTRLERIIEGLKTKLAAAQARLGKGT
jgi:hypothetical protein